MYLRTRHAIKRQQTSGGRVNHEKVVCRFCNKIIRQCRCIEAAHNLKLEICDSCKIKMDTLTEINPTPQKEEE